MTTEIGRIEISDLPEAVSTQTDMAGVPPRRRIGIGSGLTGNGGGVPPAFLNAFSSGETPSINFRLRQSIGSLIYR